MIVRILLPELRISPEMEIRRIHPTGDQATGDQEQFSVDAPEPLISC
jgi:hypothetical protein